MTTTIDHAVFIRAAEADMTGETSPLKRAHRLVLEDPSSDFNRGVYADVLDALGEHERAEFIRVQVDLANYYEPHELNRGGELRRRERELLLRHWQEWAPRIDERNTLEVVLSDKWQFSGTPAAVFRRGFVSRIECSLAQFMGGPCARCGGTGGPSVVVSRIGRATRAQCEHCPGTITGLVDTLFAVQPVTEVVLSQSTPIQLECDEGNVFHWMAGQIEPESPHFLGRELFDVVDLPVPHIGGEAMCGKYARTWDEAVKARDTAAVALGRERAGLPPL